MYKFKTLILYNVALAFAFLFLVNIMFVFVESFAKIETKDDDEENNKDNKKKKGKIKFLDDPNVQSQYIQKFDSNGTFMTSWGVKGQGDGEFLHPHGIAIDNNDSIYISDELKQDIQIFNTNGELLDRWNAKEASKKIEGLYVDSDGFVYVVDYGESTILKYSNDGELIKKWGKTGNNTGELRRAFGIEGIDNKIYYI